jgi:L-asparaginase
MQSPMPLVVILATGGTIAGTASASTDTTGYRAGALGVDALIAAVPALAGRRLEAESVAAVDSKDMDIATWQRLAGRVAHHVARPEVAGVVITHGTDTLEETAFFLQAVLAPGKPVVLTGAMRPATSAAADGPQNLADALTVAASGEARGVCVVFAGGVHGAADVRKRHPYRTDAFASGDAGPLAWVEEGRLRVLRPWPQGRPLRAAATLVPAQHWPRVEIVMSYAGASGAVVDALVQQGVRGLVVAGTGNGTVHHALEEALGRAQQQGVVVRRSTRCAQGRVLPQAGDRWPASELSPVKARIALMLELMT